MKEINERVKNIRESHSYTQDKLAKIIGYKPSTYSQMERTGNVPVEVLIKLSELFNTDIRYFIYGKKFLNSKNTSNTCEQENESDDDKSKDNDIYQYLDFNERNILITYRNLNLDEQREAYRLFMENFNYKLVLKKRKENKRKTQ